MSNPNDFRTMAEAMRKAADIADHIAETIECETPDAKERAEPLDDLLAKFIVQMMKIQNL